MHDVVGLLGLASASAEKRTQEGTRRQVAEGREKRQREGKRRFGKLEPPPAKGRRVHVRLPGLASDCVCREVKAPGGEALRPRGGKGSGPNGLGYTV